VDTIAKCHKKSGSWSQGAPRSTVLETHSRGRLCHTSQGSFRKRLRSTVLQTHSRGRLCHTSQGSFPQSACAPGSLILKSLFQNRFVLESGFVKILRLRSGFRLAGWMPPERLKMYYFASFLREIFVDGNGAFRL